MWFLQLNSYLNILKFTNFSSFVPTISIRVLLYLHNMPSKPLSVQCQIIVLYHPVKYVKHVINILIKIKFQDRQSAWKWCWDHIPDELKDLEKLEKVVISKRIFFKKRAIMHGKGEFSKIKWIICNIAIEVANICNI